MKIKQLGRTGLKVSEVCLGTMTFGSQADEPTAFAIMDAAERAGVTFFDTADVYPMGAAPEDVGNTERIVGAWLKEHGARERIVLATKCRGRTGPGPNDEGLSRKHVIRACEDSLRRLQTDYIDLYQTHRPDTDTPIEETMRALDDLVRDGKVRYVGSSNYPAWRLADALWTSRLHGLARYECAQPRYNILFRMIEDEVLPLCRAHGVGVIAYNPLAAGMLTGKYLETREVQPGTRFGLPGRGAMYRQRYWNDAVLDAVQGLQDFFAPRGKSLTHVALAWVLAQSGITSAILGASRPEQLEDSVRAVDVTLDAEELATCDAAWYTLPRASDPEVARR
ncbi:MAG: aldo/keto reductase [Chloroflexota bacterium]|nr:aldo/keto reductase [Chloroflexota bacterium]